jgi:hypothetical protein
VTLECWWAETKAAPVGFFDELRSKAPLNGNLAEGDSVWRKLLLNGCVWANTIGRSCQGSAPFRIVPCL